MTKAVPAAPTVNPVEENEQEDEQQVQEPTTENNPSDSVDTVAVPSGPGDETLEKVPKTEETSSETRNDVASDTVKSETTEPRIAVALSEEPEAQAPTETQGRASDELAKPPADLQPAPVAEPPVARATPLYWRRLTARYMTTLPS
jgi:hypothetical protein